MEEPKFLDFTPEKLIPESEEQLLHCNLDALSEIKSFFQDFARYNVDYAKDKSSAILPKKTCLIVKGPPGSGKSETVRFYMRMFQISAKYELSMALHARDAEFMYTKMPDLFSNTPVGSAMILKDVDALSTSGKSSPSGRLIEFLDSPGLALTRADIRKLRDVGNDENAANVETHTKRIKEKFNTNSRKRGATGRRSAIKAAATNNVDGERSKFTPNTKACVSRKKNQPESLEAVYRMFYPFTTHVPLIIIANDHQHHKLFAEFKKLSDCQFVPFYKPPMEAIANRVAQTLLQFSVKTRKPQPGQTYLVREISSSANGDIRKAMRIVATGILIALQHREEKNSEKPFLSLKRDYIKVLFDRQLNSQTDNFTSTSFLAIDCPDVEAALTHVARPSTTTVPHTVYESISKLLPYAPAIDPQEMSRKKRRRLRDISRASTTPRSTKNSNKEFSLERIEQKLFGHVQRNLLKNKGSVCTTPEQDRFCLNVMRQFIGQPEELDENGEPDEQATQQARQVILNRAAEATCRADFQEVFSSADLLTQEFCFRRSTALQQTWHDSTIAWAFLLNRAAIQYSVYPFFDSRTGVLEFGRLSVRKLCQGQKGSRCRVPEHLCTCRWLTTPSLKGSRGVCLQWEKATINERDLYDIKTNAICQSNCDRFFHYTNYISSTEQVRSRRNMLVNMQEKRKRNL